MRKTAFIKHLRKNGCEFKRQGAKHEIWENPSNNSWSTVPRHSEIKQNLCAKICKDLGIELP